MSNKRISDQVLSRIEQGFKLIEEKKIFSVSFNPIWAVEDKVTGVIIHPTQRIIIPHGDVLTTTDKFQRTFALIGTHYGMIVIYRQSLPREKHVKWVVEVCPKLVEKGFFESTFKVLENDTLIQQILDATLFEAINLEAQKDNSLGITVNDGIEIPPPVVKHKEPKTKPTKHAKTYSDKVPRNHKPNIKPRRVNNEVAHKTFVDGDHHHDPFTGTDYIFSEGRWKLAKPVPIYNEEVKDVSDELTSVVADGLASIKAVSDSADNTAFALPA